MKIKKAFYLPNLTKYEKRVFVLVNLYALFCWVPALQSLVTQYIPPHRCDVKTVVDKAFLKAGNKSLEEFLNWTIPWEKNNLGMKFRSSCSRFNISTIPPNISAEEFYTNQNRPNVVPCEKIFYDAKETSAVTEFGMVCEKKWQQPLFISLVMSGMVCGGVASGILSDRFGRRTVILVTTVVRSLIFFITSFSSNLAMYGVFVFLTGTIGLVDYITAFVLLTESLPPKYRPQIQLFTNTSYSIGSMLLPLMSFLLPDWRWFLRAAAGIGILYIPYFWFLDESLYWLIGSGKLEEAAVLLKKISKINGQPEKPMKDAIQDFLHEKREINSYKEAMKSILKETVLMKRLLVMVLSWFVVSMGFYATYLSANNLSGNRFLNMVYFGFCGVGYTALYSIMATYIGHRRSYIFTTAVAAILTAAAPFLKLWNGTIEMVAVMILFTLMGVSFSVIYGITGELFPTTSRQFAFGLCNAAARLGGIIAPFVLTVGDSNDAVIPVFLMSVIALLSSFLFAFLPETKNRKLPQTVNDAVSMKPGWVISCFGQRNGDEGNSPGTEHQESTKI